MGPEQTPVDPDPRGSCHPDTGDPGQASPWAPELPTSGRRVLPSAAPLVGHEPTLTASRRLELQPEPERSGPRVTSGHS